jgi:hypothetical protein
VTVIAAYTRRKERPCFITLPTRDGMEILKCCVVQPSEHQKILPQRLAWRLPGMLHETRI